jgi:putative ABC transport system permease protein
MNYALATLWHDKSRYLPGIIAVAFSAVLIALQLGLLLGLFSVTSIPIDHSKADVWVGSTNVLSVDLGRPVPLSMISRVGGHPGVESVEYYYQSFASWTKADGGSDLCMVIGCSLDTDGIGTLDALTPALREKLSLPAAIVIDESEFDRLGVKKVGDVAEINKQRVEVVGTVKGFRSLAGAYVWCSTYTAKNLLRIVMPPDHCTYLLLKCKNPAEGPSIARELREKYPDSEGKPSDMSVFAAADFANKSKMHWLVKTKAGIAIGYAALLGLLVGMVVTSQTLYAATTASAREYAILLALGIPRWRVSLTVLMQSFWVGVVGIALAYPTVLALREGARELGVNVLLPMWLLAGAASITLLMALVAGLFALRSVRQIEPMSLLR